MNRPDTNYVQEPEGVPGSWLQEADPLKAIGGCRIPAANCSSLVQRRSLHRCISDHMWAALISCRSPPLLSMGLPQAATRQKPLLVFFTCNWWMLPKLITCNNPCGGSQWVASARYTQSRNDHYTTAWTITYEQLQLAVGASHCFQWVSFTKLLSRNSCWGSCM